MSLIRSSINRSVVPRWRTSGAFAGSAETGSVILRPQGSNVFDGWFDRSYEEWKRNKTIGFLADLFSTAIVEGRKENLLELASSILSAGDSAPRALQGIASKIVFGGEKVSESSSIEFDVMAERDIVSRYAAKLRKMAFSFPRNSFAWHDLSYMYNLLGEDKKAEQAMLAALKVSSSHRIIARGAARFYMHRDESESALKILRKSQNFSKDPWLLAAHVAVSQAYGKESGHIATARRVLDDIGSGALHSSELGMALATHELLSGRIKKAKGFAKEAGVKPTENALAQAVWLSPRLNVDVVGKEIVAASQFAHEARSWESYYSGDWADSLKNTLAWLADEPFSTTPALHGSFLSATLLRDYSLSAKISEFGLRSNPGSWGLRNNYVVALVLSGDIASALQEYAALKSPEAGTHEAAVWLATTGLIKYRGGDVGAARQLYADSRILLDRLKDRSGILISALYQSIEEASCGEVEYSKMLVDSVYEKLGIQKQEDIFITLMDEMIKRNQKEISP